MDLSYENSETKIFYEKLLVSKQDRDWLEFCAREIFGIFGLNSKHLCFDGNRYYLQGNFFEYKFDPRETVASNIFGAAHLQTFEKDPRSELSTFGKRFCLIHPNDLSKIELIFSNMDEEQVAFRLESKSINLALIQISCLIVFNLRNGVRVFTLDMGSIKTKEGTRYYSTSGILRRILCLIFNGGIARTSQQVIFKFIKVFFYESR